MKNNLWEHLAKCTVKIELPNGVATGTIIAPGLIVTCAHVIPKGATSLVARVEQEQVNCDIVELKSGVFPDLALAKLPLFDRFCVYLQPDIELEDHLYCFGYTDDYQQGDSATVEFEGWAGPEERKILKLKQGQIRPGLSGAPLLNLRTGAVCGIVRITRDRSTDLGGRAIPSNAIIEMVESYASRSNQKISLELNKTWKLVRSDEREEAIAKVGFLKRVIGSLEPAQFFKGRQKKLEELDYFWDSPKGGVISLVGLGGSGKTALVRKFLELRGWLHTLSHPNDIDKLFIWSFYDYPSTSDFLQIAHYFFAGETVIEDSRRCLEIAGNAHVLAETLERSNGRNLIILDGLEKMQSQGVEGEAPRGTLEDPPLKHFLLALVDGICGNTKAIITSRFPLTDLTARLNTNYLELGLDDLDQSSAQELLRTIGVKGPLSLVLNEFGRHALTLDLLGRLIREYLGGDALRVSEIAQLDSSLGTSDIAKQSYRLTRVLRAYEAYLKTEEHLVLQRLSLFRRPVEIGFLCSLFLGPENKEFSGIIADLTRPSFEQRLKTLSGMRLVALEKNASGHFEVSCHPAIRDYFYSTLGDTQVFHSAVRRELLSLTDMPGRNMELDRATINLIEELIYHTVMLGQREEAFILYRERLGYLRLGWKSGDHVRGADILRMIEGRAKTGKSTWTPIQAKRFAIDYGLYLKNLGALDESIEMFTSVPRNLDNENMDEIKESALIEQNISAVQVLRGHLLAAEQAARNAIALSIHAEDKRLQCDCQVRLATALAMRGRIIDAKAAFQRAADLGYDIKKAGDVVRDVAEIRKAWLLNRLCYTEEAEKLLQEFQNKELGFGIIKARTDVLRAEFLINLGRSSEASELIDEVKRWASNGFDQEMLIATYWIEGQLSLKDGDVEKAAKKAERGIHLADEFGYGIYWIDLQIFLGHVFLMLGNPIEARNCANKAISEGFKSERVEILGAESDEVDYQWGIADARVLLADICVGEQDVNGVKKELERAIMVQKELGNLVSKSSIRRLEELK